MTATPPPTATSSCEYASCCGKAPWLLPWPSKSVFGRLVPGIPSGLQALIKDHMLFPGSSKTEVSFIRLSVCLYVRSRLRLRTRQSPGRSRPNPAQQPEVRSHQLYYIFRVKMLKLTVQMAVYPFYSFPFIIIISQVPVSHLLLPTSCSFQLPQTAKQASSIPPWSRRSSASAFITSRL